MPVAAGLSHARMPVQQCSRSTTLELKSRQRPATLIYTSLANMLLAVVNFGCARRLFTVATLLAKFFFSPLRALAPRAPCSRRRSPLLRSSPAAYAPLISFILSVHSLRPAQPSRDRRPYSITIALGAKGSPRAASTVACALRPPSRCPPLLVLPAHPVTSTSNPRH